MADFDSTTAYGRLRILWNATADPQLVMTDDEIADVETVLQEHAAMAAELERQRVEREALVAGYDLRGHEIAELRRGRDARLAELEQTATKLAASQAALELAARTGERLRYHAERYRERAEQAEAARDAYLAALERYDGQAWDELLADRDRLQAAVDRTTNRMTEYDDHGSGMVNVRQVINLLSPTWPDGNYSNERGSRD